MESPFGLTGKKLNGDREPLSWGLMSFLVVFVPAIVIRLLFLATLDTSFLFFKYPYFAEKLAVGESIGTRLADLSPFYLYFVTAFRWITPFDWVSIKVIQALVGALNCWLTTILGRRVSGNRAVGIMAGLGLAAYGNLIIIETTLEPTVFVIFFNLLAIYCLYRQIDVKSTLDRLPGYRWLLLSALFTGISIITKPSFLLFIPLACFWIIIKTWRFVPFPKIAIILILYCGLSSSIVFTITIRNYILLNDVILVTADAGKVFFHGNSREATVLKWASIPDQGFVEENSDEPDYAHVAFRSVAAKMSGQVLTPSESSKYWTRRTLADITADPTRYLKRQRDKFLFFFSSYELHYIASAYKEYKDSLSFPFLKFSWIIALGVVGMVMAAGQFTRWLPLYGMILIYLVAGLIYVVQSRYRIPATPYLCLFAAFAVHRSSQLLRAKRFTVAFAAAGGFLLVYLLSNTVLHEKIKGIDNWFQATKLHYELDARSYFQAGRYAEAIDAATKALMLEPAFAPAYNLRGKSYAVLADNEAAIKDFAIVIRMHPKHFEGYRNLGFSYLMDNDTENAIVYLEKSLAINPGDKKTTATLQSIKNSLETDP